MFKSSLSDLAGTSDNCTPVPKEKWGDPAVVGDSLEFLRPGEKVYVFLKSKVEEYIFTDLARIYIERDNAGGVKRSYYRHEWFANDIVLGSIKFTGAGAGVTDFSCALDFTMGRLAPHIELCKSETPFARKLFVLLTEIACEQYRNKQILAQAQSLKTQILANADPASLFNMLSVTSRELISTHDPENYGHIFERCLAGHI